MSTIAALGFCLLMLALAAFQVALVFGAPIGHFAWGGQDRVLGTGKRVGSAVSILLYAVFALVVLQRAGLVAGILAPPVVDIGVWVVFGYSVLGIGMNAMSRSAAERWTMTPTCIALAALSLTVALG